MKAAEQSMLDREFLNIRCRLLDIASSLDRISRSDSSELSSDDPAVCKIKEALQVLHGDSLDRAKNIQMIFSDAYDASWLNQ